MDDYTYVLQDGIVKKIPSNEIQTDNTYPLREATKEELEAVDKYIQSISTKTGKSFYDFLK